MTRWKEKGPRRMCAAGLVMTAIDLFYLLLFAGLFASVAAAA